MSLAATGRSSSPAVLNIGELLTRLGEEFTGISASKVRFLEEKGLIFPTRTAAGYRQYSEHDVERLRFVLALQRDQYLPLRVIRDYLDAIDRGEKPSPLPGGASIAPRLVSDDAGVELRGRGRTLTEAQLRTESGASVPLMKDMLSFGLIRHVEGSFDEDALRVARVCVLLDGHGVEPRHLRPVLAAVEREFALVERVVAPLSSRKDSSSKSRAAEAAREVSESLHELHQALLHTQISQLEK